jgi:alginate O-acetyltransferase complex protein AlgI
MVFSSPRYLVFLVAVLLLLGLPLALRRKKHVLVVASSLFYAAWDWRYLGLLVAISVIDWWAADRIDRSARRGGSARGRRLWLAASIVSNLAILGWFKYCGFFLQNLNGVLASFGAVPLAIPRILLPAGISFYTFKSMSYTIDVHRRVIEPCRIWLDYLMFVTFFPELIAGPIVRASVFLPQMTRMPGPTRERLKSGAALFVMGFLKKRVIADNFAVSADQVFGAPHLYDAPSLWVGLLAYTLQIYCDFSGYSDMAIGSARMIGYDLPENFRMPYFSRNITEFWRRWHMTLSQWLRDYLYIPLGGNRRGTTRTYVNLFLTMLLGGLWHGASWNFVAWGALHGVALAVHKLFTGRTGRRMPALLGGLCTFLFAALCWIPFRAATFGTTVTFARRLFSAEPGVTFISPIVVALALLVLVAHVVGHLLDPAERPGGREDALRLRVRRWMGGLGAVVREDPVSGYSLDFRGDGVLSYAALTILLFSTLFGAVAQTSPFIYFQF